MLSLFKNWNKSKNDPNSRCSSPAGDKIANEAEQKKEEISMDKQDAQSIEPQDKPIIGIENAVSLAHDEPTEMPIFGNEHLSIADKIDLALHTVYDPEIPVNIMELGLVYDIEVKEDNTVFVVMTLTAPGCPVAGDIVVEVENKIRAIEGVVDVHVQLTFEPQWTKDMMSEEAKLELGFL